MTKLTIEIDTEKPKDIELAYSMLNSLMPQDQPTPETTPEDKSKQLLEMADMFKNMADQFKKPVETVTPVPQPQVEPL